VDRGLVPLLEEKPKKPRDLSSIAKKLDKSDGFQADDYFSAQYSYVMLHSFVSNAGVHASVSSIKRYAKRDGEVLLINPKPEPLFGEPPILGLTSLIKAFASEVFEALGLPTDKLPTGIVRPRGLQRLEQTDALPR